MSKPPSIPPGRLLGKIFVPPPRTVYATWHEHSRGRFFTEEESSTRTCFQRDRDRIIHSTAFRRLKHKTQVFVQHEGDHYRTRLTHSLEVAQIARSLSRVLGLDEDLAEALALSHDLGHPPFGHAGEAALDACMEDYGGFDHNAQALTVVTSLEHRYVEFDGLNLTWETLEGLVKHNGPLLVADRGSLPEALARFSWNLELHTYAGLEAQIAALSDDIAYVSHDIDDGLRAGLFDARDLFEAPLAGPIFAEVMKSHPNLELGRVIGEGSRRLITKMVVDVITETELRLSLSRPQCAADVRSFNRPIAAFSEILLDDLLELKSFLYRRMYRHQRVMGVMEAAQKALIQLFQAFMADCSLLPKDWMKACADVDKREIARAICNYIAGMTDNFALQEYQRVFRMEFPL